MTYTFLQQYWWFIVSLLAGLLVFLLFVQGGNSLLLNLPKSDTQRRLMINSTGRKWEFTFTTLVTFGGAFFASFPLFYSTSFGGAYWLWMILLFSFVLQAVSYEFRAKAGNLLGEKTYHVFLVINGIVAPLLLGGAVSTFFTGSQFMVNKDNIASDFQPVISQWTSSWHGLEALVNPWNLSLGIAVLFLARVLAELYFINNINERQLQNCCHRRLWSDGVTFLIFFLIWFIHLLLMDGFAVEPETGAVVMEPYKYLNNLLHMPIVLVVLLVGVVAVLFGILRTLLKPDFEKGIWFTGVGAVLTVTMLMLLAGYNHTAYYPSTADLQSSLTLENSCSSEFTLTTMFYVSLLVPFVLAYIVHAWRKINDRKIDASELMDDHAY